MGYIENIENSVFFIWSNYLKDKQQIYINEIKMKIPKPEKYSTTKVRKEILDFFHKEYMTRLESGIFTTNKQSPF